jgi:hypothetical protein
MMIGTLVVIALFLVKSIFAPRSVQFPTKPGALLHWHSDYRQLRVECHQSIDRSVSPPR